MTTIKDIQELATQTKDWTKKQLAKNLLKDIQKWRNHRAGLDKTYLTLHKWFTGITDSYPKYPHDIPQSVADVVGHIYAMDMELNSLAEYSEGAKAHAKRIDEYLTFLSIWSEDREQLWEEIAQKEDN